MIVGHEKDVDANLMNAPEIKDAAMKALVSPEEGWDDHVMRVVEVGADGYTPFHTHPWPHINYILEGEGFLHMDGQDHAVTQGSYAFVPGGIKHQFKNAGKEQFKFICIVPKEGHIT